MDERMRKSIEKALSRVCNLRDKSLNFKELLLEVEQHIVTAEYSLRNHTHRSAHNDDWALITHLLEARRHLLNKMFVLDQQSYDKFKQINDTLTDLTAELHRKMAKLYDAWLSDEEPKWRNDCNVEGIIFVEGPVQATSDDTGSNYAHMLELIERIDGNRLYEIGFSGTPNEPYPLSDASISSCRLFGFDGPTPFGDFTMCRAFDRLYAESLYSHQDILQLSLYWSEAHITHQRIVNYKGILQ